MLSDLQAKFISEGEAAQNVYHEFSEFCECEVADLKATIEIASADIDSLNAK